jgi:hypothetical protein
MAWPYPSEGTAHHDTTGMVGEDLPRLIRAESGTAPPMKFFIGFIAGLAVGGFWVSNSTEEQRRRARAAATSAGQRIKGSKIGQTIDENASKVASTASDRVVDTVDSAGDALAGSISGGDGHATN